MSVINTMLRKLDARGASVAPGAAGVEGVVAPPFPLARSTAVPWRLPALVLVGGSLIAFAALADWPQLLGTPAPVDADVPAPVAAVVDEDVAAAAANTANAASESAAGAAAVTPAALTPKLAQTAQTTQDAQAPTAAEPRATAALAPTPSKAAQSKPLATAQPAVQSVQVAALSPRSALPAALSAPPATAPAATLPGTPPKLAETEPRIDVPASLTPPVALPARIEKRPVALSTEQRVQLLMRQATELAQAGQRRAALDKSYEALKLSPQHGPTRLLAAVLEHESGANDRAAALLQEGLVARPGEATHALMLARLQVASGAGAGALKTLEQYAVTGADADGLRGGILAQQGNYPASLAAYESAARQQPGQAMWWFGLAVALDALGQGPRAKQAYARATSLGLARDDLVAYADQRVSALD